MEDNAPSRAPFPRALGKTATILLPCIFTLSLLFLFSASTHLPHSYHPSSAPPPPPCPTPISNLNHSKLALLIESRPLPLLAAHLLHMISIVPPDWRFLFLGSPSSVPFLRRSSAVQTQVQSGKLAVQVLPVRFPVEGQEALSQTLTSAEFWRWLGGREVWDWEDPWTDAVMEEEVEAEVEEKEEGRSGKTGSGRARRPQVEWVFLFQTDSILCANSPASLNDWLSYDWVGAPWSTHTHYGGNGGLSLRRVSRIIQVVQYDTRRPGHFELEDLWLIQRIGILPGARMANGTLESRFSVENVWYDRPMGYHLGASGRRLPGGTWNSARQRERIWEWCPEVKLILDMRLERECQVGMFHATEESMQDYDEYNGQRLRWSDNKRRTRRYVEWPEIHAW